MNERTLSAAALRNAGPAPADLYGPATTLDSSAVSWNAIFAGAAGAAALSLILLMLGTGLGLSSVSPFSGQGLGATAFGLSTISWLTFTQLAASGMGGYLAGRLRSQWIGTDADEIYFRDTAHGFLAWAVATLVTAAMLTSAIGSILNAGTQAGSVLAGGAAATATAALPAVANATPSERAADGSRDGRIAPGDTGLGYFVDSLFRKDASATVASSSVAAPAGTGTDDGAHSSAEVARIYANGMRAGSLAADDTKYVGQLIAQRTGLPPADAEKRAADAFTRMQAKAKEAEAAARDAADKARKASSYAALWLFVSLLVGAFVASLAATYGGRRRDL
jgi:hypothetical protein